MALSKKRKKQLAKEPLIISEEKLSLFNAIVEKVGGLSEFEKAFNLWQFKGEKELIEDVISPEQLAKILSYDEDGNVFLKNNGGNGKKAGDKIGTMDTDEYIKTRITFGNYDFKVSLNKIVFCLHNGRWAKKGFRVDHINGITTDNRPCNLRESTNSQNGANAKLSKRSKTGIKGVFLSIKKGKTIVTGSVYCNRVRYQKSVTLGKKPLEILIQELKTWRDEKSKELFGEFHRSN